MEQFNKRRGTLKAKITVFKNFIEGIMAAHQDVSQRLSEVIREEIELRLARAKETLDQFDLLQEEIDSATGDPAIAIRSREGFEGYYFQITGQARALLARGLPPRQDTNISNNVPYTMNIDAASGTSLTRTPGIKLPTIELPKFNGDLSDWLGFRDTYKSLIHENKSISDIQKFHYLRASLGPNAGEAIKSLELSELNYHCAWNTLCSRHTFVQGHEKRILRRNKTRIRHINEALTSTKITRGSNRTLGRNSNLYYVGKLDTTTARSWEQEKSRLDSPKLVNFTEFLTNRAEFLRTLEFSNRIEPSNSVERRQHKTKALLATERPKSCILCKQSHFIQNCPSFLELNSQSRATKIRELSACLNCLRKGHVMADCKGGMCKRCGQKHNTLIHFDHSSNSPSIALCSSNMITQNILATAIVSVQGPSGRTSVARLVLDSCSQSNFISEQLCRRLELKRVPINIAVETLNGGSNLIIKNKCNLRLSARHSVFKTELTCLICPKILERVPHHPINLDDVKIPAHLKLADASFSVPARVDILLGAEWFWRILCVGQISLNQQGLVLQKTKLGWIVGGPNSIAPTSSVNCNMVSTSLEDKLEAFWSIESPSVQRVLSFEERECERIFASTFTRNEEGRFVVTIPLKIDPSKLGDSRESAERRLLSLERKFNRQPRLKEAYIKFLKEYEELGHMSPISDARQQPKYYMPHHCVFKSNKIRVVFDASAVTETGISLNDIQMIGPTIQDSLFGILVRFRRHTYILSADVEKMYRQVLVTPEQRLLQCILWRPNLNEPIRTYCLNTVTYGTASASFLSVRALFQLGYDCESELPIISRIIRNDFYVDDLLTGADTIERATFIASNISRVLAGGCFRLRKWMTNEPSIVECADDLRGIEKTKFSSADNSTKTLGLKWNSGSDTLSFSVNSLNSRNITKRHILSDAAQIFDPLGLLGPVTIVAKIFIQKLWQERLSWDESLPSDLHTE
ncbi:uncharacterized protein [Prorops nasuta]|uniref:uncharacterized protein n=1 Tax=Prorops nasuta TaxID=863751 RepID=UPI0034CFA118